MGNRAALTQPAAPAVSIPALFAAQVVRAPEAVALTYEQSSWTYRELEEAANRLAHQLIGRGVGPGQCVALLLERSAEAIVAILAVLKTGAAYLPIDPGHPDARIGFMLADAAPIAAITTADLADRLDGHGLQVVDVNAPAVDSQPSTALPAPARTMSPTSSTPRARPAYRRVWRSPPQRDPAAGLSGFRPESAAGSGVDAVSFLGVRLLGVGDLRCAAARGAAGGGARCGGRLTARLPCVTGQGTSQRPKSDPFGVLCLETADELAPELGYQLKLETVVFGGEALEPHRLATWLEITRVCPRLINMYGITETTVHASFREIVDLDADSTVSPIGLPVPTSAFLCWTGGCGRYCPGWSVSCMWPVVVRRSGMWAGRG